MNYYNEIEFTARRWLRELIKDGLIPDGYIDNRPVQEVRAEEITRGGFRQCHFFAGIGGWPLALRLAGVPDDEPLWTGSCPCQPFSQSGRQMGNADSRHLFPTWRRLIARCGPAKIFGEQVASGLGREWLARVRIEMASLGYATRAADLCSAGVAAPNLRQRLYWMADSDCASGSQQRPESSEEARRETSASDSPERARSGGMADSDGDGLSRRIAENAGRSPFVAPARLSSGGLGNANHAGREGRGLRLVEGAGEWPPGTSGLVSLLCSDGKTRRIKPEIFPLASRLPGDLGLIRGAGNAINPWIAAEFIKATR